jgi:hypothetical protein
MLAPRAFKRVAQHFAAAIAAEDHHPTAAHIDQFGQLQQGFRIEAQGRRNDVADSVPRQFPLAALAQRGDAQPWRPGARWRSTTASARSIALGLTNTARSKLIQTDRHVEQRRHILDVADLQHRIEHRNGPCIGQGRREVRRLTRRARDHDMATGQGHANAHGWRRDPPADDEIHERRIKGPPPPFHGQPCMAGRLRRREAVLRETPPAPPLPRAGLLTSSLRSKIAADFVGSVVSH